MMKRRKSVSWWTIIIWTILFWPVGIYYLIKKLHQEPSGNAEPTSKNKLMMGLGILFIILSLGSIGDGSSLFLSIFLFIGGVMLIRYSSKLKDQERKAQVYHDFIVNREEESLLTIANALGKPVYEVERDIQEIIDYNQLKLRINYDTSKLIYTNKQNRTYNININHNFGETSSKATNPNPQRIVVCDSCGAKNIISGQFVTECQYCGSPIA